LRPGQNVDVEVAPVVMAAYGSQSTPDPRIVNEDSLGFELDDSDLFRPNGAPNYDLWEPGARVSMGVRATARAHSGESLSFLFGRRWRDQVDDQFSQASNLREKASDWVGMVQTDLGHNFGAEARFQLDDTDLNVQRIDVGVRAAIDRFSTTAHYFS